MVTFFKTLLSSLLRNSWFALNIQTNKKQKQFEIKCSEKNVQLDTSLSRTTYGKDLSKFQSEKLRSCNF